MTEIDEITLRREATVEDELELCFRSDAPSNHEELFNLFVFDKDVVNAELLKEAIGFFDLNAFVNVQKVYLLTEEQIAEDYHGELEMCDTEGLIYDEKVAIHNLETGYIVINLNKQIESDISYEDNVKQLLLSILHEIRHAQQFVAGHPFHAYIVDAFRQKYHLAPNPALHMEDMENDAESYARTSFTQMKDNFSEELFEELVDWEEVISQEYVD